MGGRYVTCTLIVGNDKILGRVGSLFLVVIHVCMSLLSLGGPRAAVFRNSRPFFSSVDELPSLGPECMTIEIVGPTNHGSPNSRGKSMLYLC